eukprot:4833880-Pleurochrysis_carterae.AAC.1
MLLLLLSFSVSVSVSVSLSLPFSLASADAYATPPRGAVDTDLRRRCGARAWASQGAGETAYRGEDGAPDHEADEEHRRGALDRLLALTARRACSGGSCVVAKREGQGDAGLKRALRTDRSASTYGNVGG